MKSKPASKQGPATIHLRMAPELAKTIAEIMRQEHRSARSIAWTALEEYVQRWETQVRKEPNP